MAAFVFGIATIGIRVPTIATVVLVATFAFGAATFPLGMATYYNVF
jgi:hypothetical protein